MSGDAPRLAMVAGETSGDLLAGLLMRGIQARWPQARCAGIGGPRMAARGFDAWWPSDKLAVRGYVEVLRHYAEISGIRRQLAKRLLAERPDAFIGVDAPDFNLGLETRLREAGVRTIHFVCPSIWAWRAGRVKKIARAVDHVLCLFPFEPAILARAGVAATFVGHPLADAIDLEPPRASSRRILGLGEHDAVIAVLPGSRRSEITYNAPAFLAAAALLAVQRPEVKFLLPVAPGLRPMIEPLLAQWAPSAPIKLLDGLSHEALAACDVTLIASGTATLEAALFKRPMVIGYRMHPLTWQLMKRMRLQPWVGLPNILCGEFVVPELLQHEASPQALAGAVGSWLDAPARCEALAQRFGELHLQLRQDTATKATDAIAEVLAR
ncbi:MAG: lipid-A-disaccharide synthase [Burkholderiaceae bacterium]